jgi:queuine/archaeosine tRNA-ribosyltransferase
MVEIMRDELLFYTSLTLTQSDIRKIVAFMNEAGLTVANYLDNVLVSPLFTSKESLDRIKNLKDHYDSRVMFDSGGYFVQTGKISYEELYYPLLQLYLKNRWADVYTLPDHVPVSQDSEDIVWSKIEDTVRYSRLFFDELPPGLKERAMPVVQGHTLEQVDYCLTMHLSLGVKQVGFGSFGTSGQNKESNIATSSSIVLARHVVNAAKIQNVKVHFFGLGAPALVAMIYGNGAYSFDSSSWIKTAGFGQVFLPFMRSYNISHRNKGAEMQKAITVSQFRELCNITQHSCPFCQDIEQLQSRKMYRTLHNLIVIKDTVQMINSGMFKQVQKIYQHGSPRYQQEYEKWLAIA